MGAEWARFEARTLCLSRHGNTRGRTWWRGFVCGLLAALAAVLAGAVGMFAYFARL